ncbi:hypothetical protein D9M72_514330 [compost metagenome]
MDGGGATDGLGPNLGEADMADISSLHHVGDRTNGIFDRNVGIEPGGTIDVDMIDAKPLQRVGEKVANRLRPAIIASPVAGSVTQCAELHTQQRLVAPTALQRLADQHLVVAHTIEVTGIEQRDAGLQRGVDGGDAFGTVGRAVHAGHAHAAESERRHRGAGLSE